MGVDEKRLTEVIEQKKRKYEEALKVIADEKNAEIIALSAELFGDDLNKAVGWLLTPIKALSGDAPVDRLNSDEGRQLIKTIIIRIEHGIHS